MYGTKKPTGPWRLSLQIAVEPRCPGCSEFLQGCVVEFRDGWAWCPVCVAMSLHREHWIQCVLGSDSMRECSSVANGLRFYTPDPLAGEVPTAYEWYERSDLEKDLPVVAPSRDGAYALTLAGEQALAGLDVSELTQTEATLKRVRSRNCQRGVER